MITGIGTGNGVGLIRGLFPSTAPSGGDLINTHSLEVNAFRFVNDGLGVTDNPITMSFTSWFKFPSGMGTCILFIHDVLPSLGSGDIRLSNQSGIFYFQCYTNEDPAPQGGQTLWRDRVSSGATDYRDNSWHQIMVTMDAYDDRSEDMHIYIDGSDVTTPNLSEGDTIRPTPFSIDPTVDMVYGNVSPLSGALVAQQAYFDYLVNPATIWNGGAVFDLNSLPTPPLEWYQYAENIDNSGSSGGDGTRSAGTASYSTDVPPE